MWPGSLEPETQRGISTKGAPPMSFDDAVLAYMDRYYAGPGPQADYYRSLSSPRDTLRWHKDKIVMHPNDLASEFDEEDPMWLVLDGSTSEQLVTKAQQFVVGFYEFLKTFDPDEARAVLDEIKQAKDRRGEEIINMARMLRLEQDGAILPPTPEDN
jgi:hypothetical protein